jgi:hypothetical protein
MRRDGSQQVVDGHPFELWQADRFIERFEPALKTPL